ncbi:hypothetical protein [uncultured Aquimarina sp.]|uniref:hypothetical protein n=1 Tax=uncultured Aquimarina sp. TaxID=575652 RepID=UPI00260D5778|nr:hypothetical protein [uncultured Aquimarina sp.]
MRNLYLIMLCCVTLSGFGQETYYKRYGIKNFIDFLEDKVDDYDYNSLSDIEKSKVIFLSKEECLPFPKLTKEEKAIIQKKLDLVRNKLLSKVVFTDCSGNSIEINSKNVNNQAVIDLISAKVIRRAKIYDNEKTNTKKNTYDGGLLFKDDRLYVNFWPFIPPKKKGDKKKKDKNTQELLADATAKNKLNIDNESREELFYKLPDDHTATFHFTEYTITAITIPLKYRFQTDRDALDSSDPENITEISVESEEFSTSVNIALFGGWTWGKTKFTHRKKIGNRTNTKKNTIGLFLGSSAVELKSTNTDITLTQPQGDREGTFGTISFGLGYVKSWNKISIGLFTGIDKGVGRVSEAWIYDGKPWLGIGVGYDLFKL